MFGKGEGELIQDGKTRYSYIWKVHDQRQKRILRTEGFYIIFLTLGQRDPYERDQVPVSVNESYLEKLYKMSQT